MEIITLVLSIVTGIFMPWAIQFVAKSSKHWLNLLISYGSSALIGALTAWIGGQISHDIYASILAAIVAAQLAYSAYWKVQIKESVKVNPIAENIEQ